MRLRYWPEWLDNTGHKLHLPRSVQRWLCWRADKFYGVPDENNPRPR